jgi:hypothetical protein
MTEVQGIALDDFLASACDGLEDERIAARAQPDLADAVARSHALDPTAVPRAWVEAARDLPPIAQESTSESATPQTAAELRFFLDEVRGLIDEQAAAVITRSAAMPRPVVAPRSRRRWVVGLLAAAAIAALGLAVASDRWLARSEAPDVPREVAGDVVEGREAHEVAPPSPERTPIAELPTATPTVTPIPAPIVRGTPRRDRPAAAPVPAAAPSVAEPTLEELEREAQRRWQQGDLAGARERFEAITARGGRSSIAELAFGDLITLALRSKDPGRVRTAWSKYLARFPRGRYADDARAGLCRTAAAANQRACWRDYLDDWPDGAHRGEARESSSP